MSRRISRTMSTSSEAIQELAAFEFNDKELDFDFVDVVSTVPETLSKVPETLSYSTAKAGKVVDSVQRKLNEPLRVKLKDKIAFVFGVTNACLTFYIVGAWPDKFYIWHTLKALTLIPLRYFLYKLSLSHYFLLDFCYYANLILLYYLWVAPTNVVLFKTCFAFR
eukprot:CAMPEP_0175943132 /NCGR_PEP_ID=MMETSP0108-20121206/25367_1 /TAXON_ID=195067 ORGANISM="Goniomonas pacifica, Strain CCMP1869" /NCGR_SAMPLE_ID=MMETSP0108 /ASSEMBLY_ACC=CAM_ASM_000204 /LENGTH=164 /DNA_ID=CAMNT_0017268031 /DNA_START=29 /DNA_END=523 /DNA_ORIENTATION=-